MSDSSQRPPHFLRVVRALARVSGVAVAVPVAAVVTSFAVGCSNDKIAGCQGFCYMGTGGADTGTSSSTGGQGGGSNGFVLMDAGYDGALMGIGDAGVDSGYDGSAVGDMAMPDGGSEDGGSDGGL